MNYKKIIPLLIAALGFTTACDKEDSDNENGFTDKYGVPTAKYQQKSNVPIEDTIEFIKQEDLSNEQ